MNELQSGRSEYDYFTKNSPLKWAILLLFTVIFVVPVLFEVFYKISENGLGGRIGLILPVLTIAQPENRTILIQALAQTLLTIALAHCAGMWLGMIAAGRSGSLTKRMMRVVLWPGSLPAWPILWILAGLVPNFQAFSQNELMRRGIWIIWVGWWGGLRVARTLALTMPAADRTASDAALMFSGGFWSRYRLTIRPFFQANLRRNLLMIASVSLFDPTPALLGLTNRTPMNKIMDLLQDHSGVGLAQACVWFFWVGLILGLVNLLLKALFQTRHTSQLAQSPSNNGGVRFLVPGESFWILAIWPFVILVLAGALGQRPSAIHGAELHNWLTSDQVTWSFLTGIVVSGILSFMMIVLDEVFPAFKSLANSITPYFSSWPVALPALSAAVAISTFSATIGGGESSTWLWVGLWLMLCVVITLIGTGQIYDSNEEVQAQEQASIEKNAAIESAMQLGASASVARQYAAKTGASTPRAARIASLFREFWWVWCSPAWCIAGFWTIAPMNQFGKILAGQSGGTPLPAMALIFLPVLASGLIQRPTRS